MNSQGLLQWFHRRIMRWLGYKRWIVFTEDATYEFIGKQQPHIFCGPGSGVTAIREFRL